MTSQQLSVRFSELCTLVLPRPGTGATPQRHQTIFAAGREDLSLAKLVEAHWDAVAILEEAGRTPVEGARYAVWASENPVSPLTLQDGMLDGRKDFCSGAALVSRALVTAGPVLVDIDLQAAPASLSSDESGWQTEAFRLTRTATLTFMKYPVSAIIGEENWYTRRPGFWQGACGPAAAWAGGAAGLVDYALEVKRTDAHTMAHLAAMHADIWAMETLLAAVGQAFDHEPRTEAVVLAMQVRHMVEQMSTDVLRRFARALGPASLLKSAQITRRYAELDLFLRQWHGERDLESLGRLLKAQKSSGLSG